MRRLIHSSVFLVLLWQFQAGAAESLWQRVVLVGASASSGFVLSEPFGGTNTDQCRLSHYLNAAIAAPHEPIKNFATAALFLSPEGIASQEMVAATNCRPTLLVAADFLFWFCYGTAEDDTERAARLEFGLHLLDKAHCPMIVGDIPDASRATNSGIISPAQVPDETVRLAANRRIHAWAKARANVVVLPLSDTLHDAVAGGWVDSKRFAIPKDCARNLIQPDQLHPNPHGAAALSLVILDNLAKQQPRAREKEIDWNFTNVYRKGMLAASDARPKASAGKTD